MAFEPNRPFGFGRGFEPGREFASPFGASRPDFMGLGDIGAAAQQASQFPVMSGGGGGGSLPMLSQVEVIGGPSQIGDTAEEGAEGLAGGIARATRIADEAPPPVSPAQLALLSAQTGQKGTAFARDFSNLSFFNNPGNSGGGSVDFSAGEPGSQVSGGELGLDSPGGGEVTGSGALQTTGSGASTLASLLRLLAATTGSEELALAGQGLGLAGPLAGAAGSVVQGGLSALDLTSLPGVALAAAQPFIKTDEGNQRALAQISQAITLANMMLTQTGYGAAVSAAIGSGLEAYKGAMDPNQSAGETAFKSIFSAIPLLGTGAGDIGDLLYDRPWEHFGARIGDTAAKASGSLGILQAALPYARTKEELGQIVNAYQNHLSTTTDWGGQGFAGTEPYQIGSLPQAGGSAHEGGATYDFGPQVNMNQQLINLLRGSLPGTELTAGYGEPGGSFASDADRMRLWQQFTDRTQNMPGYRTTNFTTSGELGDGGGGQGGGWSQPVESRFLPQGYGPAADYPIRYGEPGYAYEGGPTFGGGTQTAIPRPGQFLGDIAPEYLELLLGQAMVPTPNTPGRAQVIA